MIFSRIEQIHQTGEKPTTLIIGSGAVGLYLGKELSKAGHRVVVIESGGFELSGFDKNSFRSVGVPHQGISTARSRTLGGTTNLWGGQLGEFQPADFAGRNAIPNSDWPIGYDEVNYYYALTYKNLGISSETLVDANVWQALKRDTPFLSDDVEIFLTRWLRTPNFASLYSDEINNDPNLQVLIHHTVTGFVIDGEEVRSVRIVDKNGATGTIDATTFVLAAGTVESVRLLLTQANDNDVECPWRGNSNVGKFFSDHIGGILGRIIPSDDEHFFDTFSSIVWRSTKLAPKIRYTNKALIREQLTNVQGFVSFDSALSENLDVVKQFIKAAIYSKSDFGFIEFIRNLFFCVPHIAPLVWRYLVDNRVFVPTNSEISFLFQAEQLPCRDSKISIDFSSLDENGMPQVVVEWKLSDDLINSIKDFGMRTDAALQKADLGRLEMDEDLSQLRPEYMSKLRDTSHQSGGAIMGLSAEDGVVDSNLKVFGTKNLYVGGAAVFPTVGNANITFTALALATRLAEHISAKQ